MNDTDKYYTPKIEEFYVGFEFDYFDEDDKDWTSISIKNQTDLCNWTGMIIDKRVKYLDEQDIEILDWENLNTKGTPTLKKVKGLQKLEDGDWCESVLILRLRYFDNIPYITIFEFDEHNPNEKEIKESVFREPIFRGKIKNKSKLKEILKMITE